jgi:hypothetical protein
MVGSHRRTSAFGTGSKPAVLCHPDLLPLAILDATSSSPVGSTSRSRKPGELRDAT